jgi:hypothetical protein
LLKATRAGFFTHHGSRITFPSQMADALSEAPLPEDQSPTGELNIKRPRLARVLAGRYGLAFGALVICIASRRLLAHP